MGINFEKDNEKAVYSFINFNSSISYRLFFGFFYLPTTSKSKTTYHTDRERKKTYRYL